MPIQQKLPPPVLLFSDFAGWVTTLIILYLLPLNFVLVTLVVKTESIQQNLIDSSSHHKCVVGRYEKSIAQIQEELTQTKAKLVRVEKDRESARNTAMECSPVTSDIEVERLVSSSMESEEHFFLITR